MTGAQVSSQETHGAKYFQNGTADATVAQDVTGKAKMVPAANRSTCFIIGGVPFELAKQVRNGKERYTVLKAPADYKAEGEKQKAGLNIYKNIADATGCKQFVFDWGCKLYYWFPTQFVVSALLGRCVAPCYCCASQTGRVLLAWLALFLYGIFVGWRSYYWGYY
jgi:hypothetical protein